MELYSTLEQILLSPTPKEKIAAFHTFYDACQNHKVAIDEMASPPIYFDTPSYAGFCTIVDPKVVPKRSKLWTLEGQVLLVHAIAHIEYSAIDLALDAAYRFRDLGEAFIQDWLKVAADEVRHFLMLQSLLEDLGSYYGQIEVHNALFEASQDTQTLLERMAVVPRYLEANGLDATPLILRKLQSHQNDPTVRKIVAALHIILEEEIEHVRIGDHWFNVACQREGVEKSIYFKIIETLYPKSFPRKVEINATARREAGFACEELQKISAIKPC